MRISSIDATDIPPIKRFKIEEASDVIVLAGINGVGKTRLVNSIIENLRSRTAGGSLRLTVEATSEDERNAWGARSLSTELQSDRNKLNATLQANRRRRHWTSSVVKFESDRSIQRLKALSFSWDLGDPWEESIGWDQTFGGLKSRFQDTVHSIFRKVQARRNQIARRAERLMQEGEELMSLDFKDPVQPFKEAFSRLLAPKELVDPDPKNAELQFTLDGRVLGFASLSSGEREVVNIVFDFLLRNPSDCIVFFDEPELHLHPELSAKLIHSSGRRRA